MLETSTFWHAILSYGNIDYIRRLINMDYILTFQINVIHKSEISIETKLQELFKSVERIYGAT